MQLVDNIGCVKFVVVSKENSDDVVVFIIELSNDGVIIELTGDVVFIIGLL